MAGNRNRPGGNFPGEGRLSKNRYSYMFAESRTNSNVTFFSFFLFLSTKEQHGLIEASDSLSFLSLKYGAYLMKQRESDLSSSWCQSLSQTSC